jgi:hypothetical protein
VLRRKWLRLTEKYFGVNGKSAKARVKRALKAFAMPVSILAHLPKVLSSPALRDTGERRPAAITLARLRLSQMGWMLGQALRGA